MAPRFDSVALYHALDNQRAARGLTWQQVAREVGVSAATITRTRDGGRMEVDGMLAMVQWLGVPVERFVSDVGVDPNGATFRSHRTLPHRPQAVFEAFARPELLTRWWGPAGFTSTFELFDFRPGGRWVSVLHGPDGSHHPNESIFLELDVASKLVIHHVSAPRYMLTVTMTAQQDGTAITWVQQFEDPAVAARIRHIVEPANEQNLDRLQSVLAVDS